MASEYPIEDALVGVGKKQKQYENPPGCPGKKINQRESGSMCTSAVSHIRMIHLAFVKNEFIGVVIRRGGFADRTIFMPGKVPGTFSKLILRLL
jgi:hypothetical protein